MEDHSKLPPYLAIPQSIDITPDGTVVREDVLMPEDADPQQVAEHMALDRGVDPSDITVKEQGTSARDASRGNRAGKVFGFSNWNGSKWEPRGPKGDPTLN
ncbi:TPA: hypothetical protein EYO12_01970 [Candidatus Saccharibacteria bacterium]|nr:hypothetical protein [Candidatus Saccharibacteria bacterium]HIO87484.1 hypothetical protein [Candidatus Saccharibacteria bacterium]